MELAPNSNFAQSYHCEEIFLMTFIKRFRARVTGCDILLRVSFGVILLCSLLLTTAAFTPPSAEAYSCGNPSVVPITLLTNGRLPML